MPNATLSRTSRLKQMSTHIIDIGSVGLCIAILMAVVDDKVDG